MANYSIVTDTNILISGIINPSGPPGQIVELITQQQIHVYTTEHLREEFKKSLFAPRVQKQFEKKKRSIWDVFRAYTILQLRIISVDMVPPAKNWVSHHPADNWVVQ